MNDLGNSVAPSDGFRDDQVEDERLVIVKMSQWEKRGANMKVNRRNVHFYHIILGVTNVCANKLGQTS